MKVSLPITVQLDAQVLDQAKEVGAFMVTLDRSLDAGAQLHFVLPVVSEINGLSSEVAGTPWEKQRVTARVDNPPDYCVRGSRRPFAGDLALSRKGQHLLGERLRAVNAELGSYRAMAEVSGCSQSGLHSIALCRRKYVSAATQKGLRKLNISLRGLK